MALNEEDLQKVNRLLWRIMGLMMRVAMIMSETNNDQGQAEDSAHKDGVSDEDEKGGHKGHVKGKGKGKAKGKSKGKGKGKDDQHDGKGKSSRPRSRSRSPRPEPSPGIATPAGHDPHRLRILPRPVAMPPVNPFGLHDAVIQPFQD